MLKTILILLFLTALSHAQDEKTLQDSKFGTDCAYANFFAGPAGSLGGSRRQPTFTAGVTFGQYFARPLGQGLTVSPQFELGLVGPLPAGKLLDGLVSVNAMISNQLPRRHLYPSFTAGYTRLFVTGNAVNFGVAVDFGKQEYTRLLRIELRDYYLFGDYQQHIVALRFAIGRFVSD